MVKVCELVYRIDLRLLHWVPAEFVRNLERIYISQYVLHEHYMDSLISMIFKVFTSVYISLYL
jgi:hypothetical protein